jgi:predicted nucleic acid-binding protein
VIVLDTSLLSLAFRRRPGAAAAHPAVLELQTLLRRRIPLAIPGIVIQEICSGLRSDDEMQRLLGLLSSFPQLVASAGDHILAARISNACQRKDVSASTIDCLISAQAITCRGRLMTTDAAFERISSACDLELYRW